MKDNNKIHFDRIKRPNQQKADAYQKKASLNEKRREKIIRSKTKLLKAISLANSTESIVNKMFVFVE